MYNNNIKTDFKEFLSISRNVMSYVYLYHCIRAISVLEATQLILHNT